MFINVSDLEENSTDLVSEMINEENEKENINDYSAAELDSTSSRRKMRRLSQNFVLPERYLHLQSQKRDELKVFSELLEHKLRKIKNPRKLCLIKHQIDKLLFDAEMDNYKNRIEFTQP